jgi:hypothetical protein
MTLRSRLFIIISLIILVVLGISLFLVVRGRKAAAPEGQTPAPGGQATVPSGQAGETGELKTVVTQPAPPRKLTTLEAEQNGVKQLANIFIERFQSYSTDADFQNVREIESMVTPALWKRLSSKISDTPPSGPFVGVTTEVVVATLKEWNPPSATIHLKTRVITEKNGAVTRTFPEYDVTLVKSGNDWLVDSFIVQ